MLTDLKLDALPELTYDPRSQRWRYRDSRQFASMSAVRVQSERYIKAESESLQKLGRDFTDSKVSLSEFQRLAAQHVKHIHLGQAITALSKQSDLSPEIFLEVGRQLKKQYYAGRDWQTGKSYGLKYLAKDMQAGKVSPAQLQHRLTMFANSGAKSYWGVKHILAIRDGYTEARRVLGLAEHCLECVIMAGQGWKPIQEITPIGERCSCRSNCKCSIKYR